MKFQGFRLPEGMITDMNYINGQTGMNKSQMVRQGLMLVINDYFQKEKVKQTQIQARSTRNPSNHGNISLPDGW